MTTAVPYLCVDDGPGALDFYARALGAEVAERYDDDDRLAHATLLIGEATVYVSDEYPALGAVAPRSVGGSTCAVVLAVADPDATYAAALAAGAQEQRPVEVDGLGVRSGWFVDPYGHRWNIRAGG